LNLQGRRDDLKITYQKTIFTIATLITSRFAQDFRHDMLTESLLLVLVRSCPFLDWNTCRDWDSTVGVATGYGLDDRGGRSSSPGRGKNFLHVIQTGCGAHSASYTMGTGVKWPGREADRSPPTSPKVNKIRLHGVVLNYLITWTTLPFLPSYT
jgi:hypothetical protein